MRYADHVWRLYAVQPREPMVKPEQTWTCAVCGHRSTTIQTGVQGARVLRAAAILHHEQAHWRPTEALASCAARLR